jgi:hypothetical protein
MAYYGEDEHVLGIVRDKDNPDLWKPFKDEDTALQHDIDDVIFGETLTECQATLDARYPPSDPLLTRVSRESAGTYRRGSYVRETYMRVTQLDDQFYDGDDNLEVLALAKKLGSVRCRLDHDARSKGDVDWPAEGCSITVKGGNWNARIREVRYNPKGVLRARKAAATRAKNSAVKCEDIGHATWAMRQLVREYIGSLSYESTDKYYSRYSVCWTFLETIKYFVFVFGKHSYRQHPAFRELKKKWKSREARSRKAFYKRGGCSDVQARFCNFMDAEIRIRNGKLRSDNKKDWQPTREFPEFDEYSQANYAKVLRARDKEEARKAKKAAGRSKKTRAAPRRKGKGTKTRRRAHAKV